MKNFIQFSFILLMFSVTACQSTTATQTEASSTAELQNTLWKLSVINGTPVQTKEGQRVASLTLTSEGSRARITTACNNGSAAFTVKGSALAFSVAMSTKMGCPADQMQQESAFFKVIDATASYKITGEVLELFDSQNNLLARLHSEYLK